jgi:hypothetical protein
VYQIVVHPEAAEQIDALPLTAVQDYLPVIDAVELAPWNGPPYNENRPDAPMRRWSFGDGGAGQVVYVVHEHEREVHVLRVLWLALG